MYNNGRDEIRALSTLLTRGSWGNDWGWNFLIKLSFYKINFIIEQNPMRFKVTWYCSYQNLWMSAIGIYLWFFLSTFTPNSRKVFHFLAISNILSTINLKLVLITYHSHDFKSSKLGSSQFCVYTAVIKTEKFWKTPYY